MTREITNHIVSTDQASQITIEASAPSLVDGASHQYYLTWRERPEYQTASTISLPFQNGPIPQVGVNGVTNEALLAIVIDRLYAFQASQFACMENYQALVNCETALSWLKKRTLDRITRGVEGTHHI